MIRVNAFECSAEITAKTMYFWRLKKSQRLVQRILRLALERRSQFILEKRSKLYIEVQCASITEKNWLMRQDLLRASGLAAWQGREVQVSK